MYKSPKILKYISGEIMIYRLFLFPCNSLQRNLYVKTSSVRTRLTLITEQAAYNIKGFPFSSNKSCDAPGDLPEWYRRSSVSVLF